LDDAHRAARNIAPLRNNRAQTIAVIHLSTFAAANCVESATWVAFILGDHQAATGVLVESVHDARRETPPKPLSCPRNDATSA